MHWNLVAWWCAPKAPGNVFHAFLEGTAGEASPIVGGDNFGQAVVKVTSQSMQGQGYKGEGRTHPQTCRTAQQKDGAPLQWQETHHRTN